MKYHFKRDWNETTGDELTNTWGISTYYFETDSDLNVIRQIQIFENGRVLKYSQESKEDQFGMLADQQLDRKEFQEFGISSSDFENVWNKYIT